MKGYVMIHEFLLMRVFLIAPLKRPSPIEVHENKRSQNIKTTHYEVDHYYLLLITSYIHHCDQSYPREISIDILNFCLTSRIAGDVKRNKNCAVKNGQPSEKLCRKPEKYYV